MGHSLPGTLQQSAVGTSQGRQSIKQPQLMGFNISDEHVRYPHVTSPLPKARRDVVLTEVSLKELRFYVKTYPSQPHTDLQGKKNAM